MAQAESDLAFAELGLRESFFAQACFVCQQATEKALKALPGLREVAQQLDQYYIPTRYPNGLPGGVPAEVFTQVQAEGAVAGARKIIDLARQALGPA